MFKKTLVAAALATASMGANAAIQLAGDAVQFYGQAAGFVTIASPDAKGADETITATIESRIGFRGVVEFEDFGPNFLWQIEGGNANHGGFDSATPWTHNDNGQLGARDTYLGLGFDGVGSIKYGRQLVAAYNYVDWPHSNPGLGNVFDWNNDINGGYQDRADNVIRFDSETFNGFNFQATVSGMESTTDAIVASIAASYQAGPVNIHGGYYNQAEYKDSAGVKKGDTNYAILGASAGFDSLTFTAAVKLMNNELADQEQIAYSATAQYVNNSFVYKLGYAATTDAEQNGNKMKDTGDTAITARLGYLLPSTYLFMDLRNYKMNAADGFDNNLLIGAEYYF
ncbi:porin [Motilimonas sp. E26]|uniref:porin n=1 Tax=Motilimonas sp. E26 TaxID=2865674 RepID=UPI001E64E162|nr:porin [Motilimonas sp. E26]MCE0556185.1 porin [Motilimonas sp. E26]